MIFSNSQELIEYVVREYPYEKIQSYCQDLGYKWVIWKDGKIQDVRYPNPTDILEAVKFMVACEYRNYYARNGRPLGTEDNAYINTVIQQGADRGYITARLENRKITINFKFNYRNCGYRFRNYSLPYIHSGYGDPRGRVCFRFTEDIL